MQQKYRYFLTMMLGFFLLCCNAVSQAESELKSGMILPTPKKISPFILNQLVTVQGKPAIAQFTNVNLNGQWTLLFFGFTNCPALCPTSMAELANAYKILANDQFEPMPQVLFVSVDPERDTLGKVTEFAQTFNKNFIGLRTTHLETLQQMTKEMNVLFQKVALPAGTTQDRDPSARYTIDHSGDIMVLNPQGALAAVLTMPHTANEIAEDYETIATTAKPEKGILDKMKNLL